MEQWIADNYEKIKNGEKPNSDSFKFPLVQSEILNKEKRGLYGTLHRADVGNQKVNPDGSLTYELKDKYDFQEWDKNKDDSLFRKIVVELNNNGQKQQEANQIEQYLMSMPINLSKEEIEEIINRRKYKNYK